MVRVVLALLVCINFLHASSLSVARSFVDADTYMSKRNLINALFSNSSKYTKSSTGEIDTLKILHVLKSNGLLNLSYENPSEIILRFDTKGSPFVALRLINDTLENMGYSNYLVKNISKHEDVLSVAFALKSDSVVDPVEFSSKLERQGCIVQSIQRSGQDYWSYKINAKNAKIKTIVLQKNARLKLNKPNRAYWFTIFGSDSVEIFAHVADNWFAKITFYDKFLHPLKEIVESEKKQSLHVKIPQNSFYMKVEDRYRLENIRRGLTFILR